MTALFFWREKLGVYDEEQGLLTTDEVSSLLKFLTLRAAVRLILDLLS